MDTNDPVVIVGAGPAGAALALILASRGIPTTLIERQNDFAREFRGEVMMPSGLVVLDALGIDLAKDGIPCTEPEALELHVEKRSLVRFDGDADFFQGRVPLIVSQPALLEHLVDLASRHPGFELLRGVAVRDVLFDDGRICEVVSVHYYDGNRGPLWHGADKREKTAADVAAEKPQSWFYQRAHGGGSLLDYLGYGVTLGTWFLDGRAPVEVTSVTDRTEGLEVDEQHAGLALLRAAAGQPLVDDVVEGLDDLGVELVAGSADEPHPRARTRATLNTCFMGRLVRLRAPGVNRWLCLHSQTRCIVRAIRSAVWRGSSSHSASWK